MIKSAGSQVEQELAGKDAAKNMIDTSAGQLKQAKRLLFLPWIPPATYFTSQDTNALRQSISTFVQYAIKYTIHGKFKSIGTYLSKYIISCTYLMYFSISCDRLWWFWNTSRCNCYYND
jgi:hypothetical protein